MAPISEAGPAAVTCGICGFAMNEVNECRWCKLDIAERTLGRADAGEDRDVID